MCMQKLISYNCFPAKGPLCPVGLNLLLKTLVEFKSQKLIYFKNSYLPKTIPVNVLESKGNYYIMWWTKTIIRCIAQEGVPKITRQQQYCNLYTRNLVYLLYGAPFDLLATSRSIKRKSFSEYARYSILTVHLVTSCKYHCAGVIISSW